ncbi:hypothetical protein QOZ84_02570 [Romboutsia sedimentorum]|uniref:Uncharacterized protein n=1 Tax=Romboutsia sedimentorum TaxID=1368474 RepID=A0ABT7E668_9FIRM|nr:hypothetical protein [Romboutsia sedimentorum]MDK2562419.1 hypothetical protein [Romboutsia sedimentorum]
MRKKDIILLIIIILLGVTGSFTENQSMQTLLIAGMFIFTILTKLTDYIYRKKLIKQINSKNMTYIKVKENSKSEIISMVAITFITSLGVKSVFGRYEMQNHRGITDIISYISGFEYLDKLLIFTYIMLFISIILPLAQSLFSYNIITDDKVIFYDNLVFKINEIEEIKYEESLLYKNKKIIVLGKGFTDRKMVVKIEDFDKVKILLESKNTL